MTEELVFTFASTRDAIRAEQALQREGITPAVMPLPGEIRAGCGLCLRTPPQAYVQASAILRDAGIQTEAYLRRVQGGKSHYERRKTP